jgi:putative acetyltransferase
MHFRTGERQDATHLADVFFASVHEGASPYTEAERTAWLPARPSTQVFAERLAGLHVVVAEDRGRIVGFMGMTPDGLIDLAFILPEARGSGVFRYLCEIIEATARADGLNRLRTHASLMAQSAIQAMDFSVVEHQIIECGGETLRRATMEKHLT